MLGYIHNIHIEVEEQDYLLCACVLAYLTADADTCGGCISH